MIPIPIFWAQYTTTLEGSAVKDVRCENCSTDYVYLIQRESSGSGTSMYLLNNEGARAESQSVAVDTLDCMLKNDFDPVPCPVCGHYQRYMFPKLVDTQGGWLRILLFAVLIVACISFIAALGSVFTYAQNPSDHSLGKMVTAGVVLLGLGLIGLGFVIVKRVKDNRFDPNLEDQADRIAIGQSRAITKAEFESIKAM